MKMTAGFPGHQGGIRNSIPPKLFWFWKMFYLTNGHLLVSAQTEQSRVSNRVFFAYNLLSAIYQTRMHGNAKPDGGFPITTYAEILRHNIKFLLQRQDGSVGYRFC